MGIRRIVFAVFLVELLTLGFGEATEAKGKLRSQPIGSVEKESQPGGVKKESQPGGVKKESQPGGVKKESQPGGVKKESQPSGVKKKSQPSGAKKESQPGGAGSEPPTSLEDARKRLPEYEKAYLAKKCISSGKCGKETGKVCAVGKCCSKEGYCWPDDSKPCSPFADPQLLYSGVHCTDEKELAIYMNGLAQYDKLVAGAGTPEGEAMTVEAAKKALDAAEAALRDNPKCITEGQCGKKTGKICAGQKCCTKEGYCWPKEHAVCSPKAEFQLLFSWPFCLETAAKEKYLKAKATYEKLRGGK